MPVTLRAVSAALSAALEKVSFTDRAAALIFQVDSSAVSVWRPSPEFSAALSACIVSSTTSCGVGSSAVTTGSSSSSFLASASPDAHLVWSADNVGLEVNRSTDGVTVVMERGFDRNEVEREVRRRNAERRN